MVEIESKEEEAEEARWASLTTEQQGFAGLLMSIMAWVRVTWAWFRGRRDQN